MINCKLEIILNEQVGKSIYKMRLKPDQKVKSYGEFINLTLPGYYLKRPFSVSDYTDEYVEIIYKVLGHGTADMSEYKVGMVLDALVDLGIPFKAYKGKKPLFVAGGIGISPFFILAKEYNELGIRPKLIYGSRSKDDIILLDELEKLCDVYVCTDDGSLGFKGNVVEYRKTLDIDTDIYYACGPQVMLKYYAMYDNNGYVSLEARMGCGFGCCMGCSIQTTNGPKRVCKDGPTFKASEVIFE